ncbi:MAG: mannose-6-phosphate isomerase [Candidatus Taylorbacteria bacterium RIFCSPLOWO2_02_FULL_43_11]|uniref:Mannose-6-phosphate isomerase n=1 Tax=Candidatus Taylorbacteria bacterium RIFCSPHIGHO2_02_FULL_43_32b TaxID=1802306 RepID=A0A1G2MKP8_9BACT|nr:MAG: mannose-6-phosphate isomerase [Candidatus Taylorbacteria bacterium RIFCSPHIGHO2_01_FULL_43_47]OHA23562.1 MAG: mannose-6-phosphate isomerase [Candidatus Taylorbacteria bacterium RIFCSPHIGHO2_02_FULL_43_32b]OHA30587.1 MAG: mannose-6-phosphate isomerase [Candidatus Taylorbacteria bacterium RIFCSPLOWO2_01_FULL_43_44]OHA36833.1 MAG: mannose-6-phosphate isomerase [Candidatus Taylorbacteria bacterium RIFCSPLOWO2_02_FULL_43_11]
MQNTSPYREERPWGRFERFTHNETSTIKILTIDPGEELSFQYHNKREEFWRVLSGDGIIEIGDDKLQAEVGRDYFVKKGAKHRIIGGRVPLSVLEIAFGDFDENDIVRLSDKYQRIK